MTPLHDIKKLVFSFFLFYFATLKHLVSMKFIAKIAIIIAFAVVANATAQAQFRFGIKGGITINELKWDKDIVSKDNRAGFTAGLIVEAGLPVVGLGIDASVLYAHRQDDLFLEEEAQVTKLKRDYLDIPVNVKYKIQIPVLCKIISPFVTTGPDFALVLGDNDNGDFKTRKWNTSWNVGFGAELFHKVQIHANYGIGMTKAFEYIGKEVDSTPIKGKDNLWTITAAYLF